MQRRQEPALPGRAAVWPRAGDGRAPGRLPRGGCQWARSRPICRRRVGVAGLIPLFAFSLGALDGPRTPVGAL